MDQETTIPQPGLEQQSLADIVAGLSKFDGPPGEFLAKLLEVQCDVADARGAAILSIEGETRVRVVVLHPPPEPRATAPLWLAEAVESAPKVLASGRSELIPLGHAKSSESGEPDQHVAQIPILREGGSPAVAVYLVIENDRPALELALERLELTIALLSLYEMRVTLQSRRADLDRLRVAMEVLDSVNEQQRMKASGFAFCNELAARWSADRVALGFLSNRYVKTTAISNTEKFDRKMKLVQDLESAMEECIDQDVEVLYPPSRDGTFVCRATGELSMRHGPSSILSLPLRRDGEAVGVVVVERPLDDPMTIDEIEMLRLTCDLCTARLYDLYEHDKWVGAKAADVSRKGFEKLVGPRHTWAKVITAAVIIFLLFIFLVRGPDRIDANFEIAAIERRLVPAPFSGRLQSVHVEPGDAAEGGTTVLAALETAELQMRLAALKAERAGFLKEEDLALRDGKTVEVQIAQANLRKIEAEIRLTEHQVGLASITAPIDGTVVVGDLKRQVGAPVETGEVLFEIAPLGATLRAEIQVPEDRITDLLLRADDAEEGSDPALRRGTLASVSHPGDYIPFEIEHVNPVAEVIEQANIFRVRVRLLEDREWLRPGMKGVAKVDVGRRSYFSLWTRKLVNWVRMKLWI